MIYKKDILLLQVNANDESLFKNLTDASVDLDVKLGINSSEYLTGEEALSIDEHLNEVVRLIRNAIIRKVEDKFGDNDEDL